MLIYVLAGMKTATMSWLYFDVDNALKRSIHHSWCSRICLLKWLYLMCLLKWWCLSNFLSSDCAWYLTQVMVFDVFAQVMVLDNLFIKWLCLVGYSRDDVWSRSSLSIIILLGDKVICVYLPRYHLMSSEVRWSQQKYLIK